MDIPEIYMVKYRHLLTCILWKNVCSVTKGSFSLKVLYLRSVDGGWNTDNFHQYKYPYCLHYTYTLEKQIVNHLPFANSCSACSSGYHLIMFINKY